jgi:predicted AlkP superfamily pyrophosphatase or phosphodiesterase
MIIPRYSSYCFSNLSGSLEKILCGSTKRTTLPDQFHKDISGSKTKIIFILFDAFGKQSYEKYLEHSMFLKAFYSDGIIHDTTAQFPSTTAAHVTTLLSGSPVYETGICEWFYYEPKVNGVINPFKYCYYNDAPIQGFSEHVATYLPKASLFRDLKRAGVEVFSYSPRDIEPSKYGLHFIDRGDMHPYKKLKNAVELIPQHVSSSDQPQFHYLYIPFYDSACHSYGPDSRVPDSIALQVLDALEPLLNLSRLSDVALMMTADHGQIRLDKGREILVNELVPEITELLYTDPVSGVVRFGGGYRNLLLYSKEGADEELANLLRRKLSGSTDVFTRQELAETGALGPQPLHEHFSRRIGDVILLPNSGCSVNWKEAGVYVPDEMRGHHGGLSAEEMETLLLVLQ